MSYDTPTAFPPNEEFELSKGDTYVVLIDLPDFKPEDSNELKIVIIATDSQQVVTATDNGDSRHKVTITSTITNALEVGSHRYQGYITDASSYRYKLDGKSGLPYIAGNLTIKPDLVSETGGYDARSMNEKILASLKSAYEEYVRTRGQVSSYGLPDGRTMVFNSAYEIKTAIDHYSARVDNEREAERIKQGYKRDSSVGARFNS